MPWPSADKTTQSSGHASDHNLIAEAGLALETSLTNLQGRQTAAVTTGSLANGASADVSLTLSKSYRLLRITTDRPARVRFYTTAAARTADASRNESTDPTGNHGVVTELITAVGLLTYDFAPTLEGASMEATPSSSIPLAVTNKSGSTSTVTVTVIFQPLGG